MDAVFPLISLSLGSLPPLVLLRLIRPNPAFLGIGASLLAATIIIQSPLSRLAVGSALTVSLLLASAVAGVIAGFVQEGLKALALRGSGPAEGAWLGAGFGIGEAALVALTQLITPSSPPTWAALVPGIERLLATWFHIVTAGVIGLGLATGRFLPYFATAVAAHAGIDFAAAYVSLAQLDLTQLTVLVPLYLGIAAVNTILTLVLVRGWPR